MNSKSNQSYGDDSPQEFSVMYIPNRGGTIEIEINAPIYEVSQFSTAIKMLNMAKEDDEVVIHLQCPGGNVDATDALIHAIRKCRAPIHCIATGGCHSAASHILLEMDSFELAAGFNSLIHCGQDGAYGNVNEYRSKAKFDEDFRVRQFRETYEGMLTNQEMDDVLSGKDIWLDGPAWCARAEARMAYFQQKIEGKTKPPRKPRKKKVVDSTQ